MWVFWSFDMHQGGVPEGPLFYGVFHTRDDAQIYAEARFSYLQYLWEDNTPKDERIATHYGEVGYTSYVLTRLDVHPKG